MTVQQEIKTYMDSLHDSWQRTSFIDRLDNIRNMTDREGFPSGASDVITSFMSLSSEQRDSLIAMFRVRDQALEWARTSGDTDSIMSLVNDLTALTENNE